MDTTIEPERVAANVQDARRFVECIETYLTQAVKSLEDLLTPQERQAVSAFVEALRQRYPDRVRDVILYGSKARGEGHPDSDIDLLILIDDEDWRFSHAISTLAARISLDYDVLLGPRVIGQARWPRSVLYRAISVEGTSLFTK